MNEQEEGTVILDPEKQKEAEEKKKAEEEKLARMKETNKIISEFIDEVSQKHNIKLQVIGYSIEDDDMGIWKSDNVNTLDEMGFSKLLGNQF